MILQIRRVFPEEATALSEIAFAAKAHWGYPERWLEIWKPQLTFSPEYFKQYESWVAEEHGLPIAFYTLMEMRGLKICGCHQNVSARVSGKCCSYTRLGYLVSAVIKFCSWKQIPTQSVFTKKWACVGSERGIQKWKVNRVSCPLWR